MSQWRWHTHKSQLLLSNVSTTWYVSISTRPSVRRPAARYSGRLSQRRARNPRHNYGDALSRDLVFGHFFIINCLTAQLATVVCDRRHYVHSWVETKLHSLMYIQALSIINFIIFKCHCSIDIQLANKYLFFRNATC